MRRGRLCWSCCTSVRDRRPCRRCRWPRWTVSHLGNQARRTKLRCGEHTRCAPTPVQVATDPLATVEQPTNRPIVSSEPDGTVVDLVVFASSTVPHVRSEYARQQVARQTSLAGTTAGHGCKRGVGAARVLGCVLPQRSQSAPPDRRCLGIDHDWSLRFHSSSSQPGSLRNRARTCLSIARLWFAFL